ncbi:MAG: hypothetical protein KBT19_07175 [Lachnospiraceae bacterium]|nr:hypothetical protein [Candidatus Colinaster equi]
MKKRLKWIAVMVLVISVLSGCSDDTRVRIETEPIEPAEKISIDDSNEVQTSDISDEISSDDLEETSANDVDCADDMDKQTEETATDIQDSNYMIFTDKSASEVEAFAQKVRDEIVDGDWNALADDMCYPAYIGGKSVNNRDDAYAILSKGASDSFIEAVKAVECKNMWCNGEGLMFANGEVWICDVIVDDAGNLELKVTAINSFNE